MMYRTKTDLSKECAARIGNQRSIRRQGLTLFGLILPLLVWGSEVDAGDRVEDIRSLELALAANGKAMPRFQLHDGQSVIGRFIEFKAGAITVRRPSGGLRSIPIADIDNLEIVDDDGKSIRGWLTALDDGTVGWEIEDPSATGNSDIAATIAREQPTETGGPLIKLAPDDSSDLPAHEAAVFKADEDEAIKEGFVQDAAVDTSRLATTKSSVGNDGVVGLSGSVHLTVTAETASESEKVMYFRLALSEPAKQSVVIIYSILNGSATAADDYKHRQGVVVFDPGQQSKALAVEIVDDDDIEDIETFKLFITGDPGSVTIDARTVEASIQDNDS